MPVLPFFAQKCLQEAYLASHYLTWLGGTSSSRFIYLVREHSDKLREVRAAKLEKARSPSRTWASALVVHNICTVEMRTDKVFFFSFETIIDLELRRITHEGIVSEAEVCECLGIG